MMVTDMDYRARKEHYRDQARAAARYRLVREALAGRDRSSNVIRQTMTWLGHRLVVWGTSLQRQYDAAVSAPAPQSANQTVGH